MQQRCYRAELEMYRFGSLVATVKLAHIFEYANVMTETRSYLEADEEGDDELELLS
jgi:hypothetical protein